jgi:hypothetical protein
VESPRGGGTTVHADIPLDGSAVRDAALPDAIRA